jgi:hypothetical protein
MPIPCLPTETSFDVQCPVCGRGFLLLMEPTLTTNRSLQRQVARRALAVQHEHRTAWSDAHPNEVFDLPTWGCEPEESPAMLAIMSDILSEFGI